MPPPTAPYLRADGSIDPAYFEALYAAQADPWDFDTSLYEAAKYAATLDALPCPRYERAFEAGCANGALTVRLAERCGHVLAVDVSPDALARARERLAEVSHVRFEQRAMPEQMPAGRFDLAVVSEVGYYLSRERLADWADRLAVAVEPGGDLALVHWTGPTDYPLSADEVHGLFLERADWGLVQSERQRVHEGVPMGTPDQPAGYRLDVLRRLA